MPVLRAMLINSALSLAITKRRLLLVAARLPALILPRCGSSDYHIIGRPTKLGKEPYFHDDKNARVCLHGLKMNPVK